MLRKCKTCGAEFQGTSRDINCPECRKKNRAKGRDPTPHTCKMCGAEFMSSGTRAYYCPSCRVEREKERRKTFLQRKAAGAVRSIGSKDICIDCGKPYIVDGGAQIRCPECAKKELARKSLVAYYSGGKEKRKERIESRDEAWETCAVCGKLFHPGARRMTCSESCQKIYESQVALEWSRSDDYEKLYIRIPVQLKTRFKTLAEKNGMTFTDYVCTLIQKEVDRSEAGEK